MSMLDTALANFGAWFLELAAQSSVVLGVALLLCVAARRPTAQLVAARTALLCVCLVFMMSATRHIALACDSASGESAAKSAVTDPTLSVGCTTVPLADNQPGCGPVSRWDLPGGFVLAWQGAGSMFAAATWLALGSWQRRRLERRLAPAPQWLATRFRLVARSLQLTRHPRLAVSSLIGEPLVYGWWRPVVVLPEGASDRLAPDQIDAVLAHEGAHVAHGDLAWLALERLLLLVVGWNPLFHALRKRMRDAQECLADSAAARLTPGGPTDYAAALVCWARGLTEARRIAVPSGLGALAWHRRASRLSRRINSLLHRAPAVYRPKRGAFVVGLVCALTSAVGLFASVRCLPTAHNGASCMNCPHPPTNLQLFICPTDDSM